MATACLTPSVIILCRAPSAGAELRQGPGDKAPGSIDPFIARWLDAPFTRKINVHGMFLFFLLGS